MTPVMLRATDPSVTSPCWRRSSGTKAMPALIDEPWTVRGERVARRAVDRARVVPVDAEDRPGDLAAPGPDQPGQADDLARSAPGT